MKKVLAFLLIVLLSQIGFAQNFQGLRQSNYVGMLGADLNPASIADSRYRFHMNMVGVSADFYNTYFSTSESMIGAGVKMFKGEGFIDSAYFADNITQNIGRNEHAINFNNEILGPSFMVNLGDYSAIGFSYKVRTYFNMDGLETPMAQLALDGLEYEDLWNLKLENENLSIQTMSWVEYSGNFARVFLDNEEHFIKAGGRLKLLQGLQSMYMFVDNLRYDITNSDTISFFESDVNYGHSTNYDVREGQLKYKYVSNPGVGLDIGVEYEWRPDWQAYKYEMDGRDNIWRGDKDKYKIKAGFSILDLGRIKFQKGVYSHDFHADIDLWDVSNLGIQGIVDFDSVITQTFLELPTNEGEYSMQLPTKIVANVDYNIGHNFYVNGMAYMAFQFKKNKNKVHDFTNFSVTPRFDHHLFGASIPLSYSGFAGFRAGLGLRVGPIMLGTSNLAGLMGMGENYGGDVYFVGNIPIRKKIPKDKDEDFVSDKFDECKDVKGVWEFRGCPDTDNDRIPDSEDACPAEAGLLEFNGCPDTDRDGIMDSEDECPTIAGPKSMNGCPDKDGDGIKDSEDKCPNVFGVIEMKGCPDTDGDGIMDREDNCPEEAGPIENYGCPNTVKLHLVDQYGNIIATITKTDDGFVFKELPSDRSYMFLLEGEDVEGDLQIILENGGERTTISASLNELTGYFEYRYLQAEKEVFELIEEEEDGVLLAKEEEEIINTAFSNLEFESGKAIISESSFMSLKELANLLVKKSEWTIKLEGHTDNVGKASSNLMLSKRRAEAVSFYLFQQGVAKDKIITKFFGQSKPIGDNETKEGRQQNRRVEMTIIQ